LSSGVTSGAKREIHSKTEMTERAIFNLADKINYGDFCLRYWLMKSEPSDVSVDDLAALPGQTIDWYGVRNYQARNFMRDQMRVGDGVLFYHSNCKEPGIAGIARVASTAYPDAKQFDRNSKYFDPKATQETPRWFNVDVQLVNKIELIPLAELRRHPELENMRTLQRGNRLSITPLDPAEWRFVTEKLAQN
jgi:predicted RNA-binding protein with PUA-like domain